MPGHLPSVSGRQLCGCHFTCGCPFIIAEVFHIIEAERIFFSGCTSLPRTMDANSWNVPWNASFHSIRQNCIYKQIHVCSRCIAAVSRTCSICQETAQSNESKCDKICLAWRAKSKPRDPVAHLPLFSQSDCKPLALFYKFIQVWEMFFLSRNNAVEHIATEHVFAFSMISEKCCFKYEACTKKTAICIGSFFFSISFKVLPVENTLGLYLLAL